MNASRPVSKVLVLDDDVSHAEVLREFCNDHNLIALTVRKDRLTSVLRSNIDLGGVILAEDYGGSLVEAATIAARIDALRPELPIILRRSAETEETALPEALAAATCANFRIGDMAALTSAVDEFIFSLDFPNALVRGISEITEARIATSFRGCSIAMQTPSVVRDRIIFGEMFSLIPLEGSWCRGYMLMQAEEEPLRDVIAGDVSGEQKPTFRDANSVLGELTNMVWGAFKDRFLERNDVQRAQVQVPLLINHLHRYISFGSDNPQLCFQYRVTNEATGKSLVIDQRFIFSLTWMPEAFTENTADLDTLVEAGELDLF
jgi:CheY-specific phosphatase CheX